MQISRSLIVGGILMVAMLIGLAAPSDAYRLIGAYGADGTYCAGTVLDCEDTDTFARWFTTIVPYFVNEDAAVDAGSPGLTQANIIGAMQAAYQSWEDVDASIIRFTYVGETTSRLSGTDGRNTTVWFRDVGTDSDPPECVGSMGVSGGLLAITILTEVGASGEITDADVLFDSADAWEWNTDCSEFEVQSVLTHEYGHSIGIHHTEIYDSDVTQLPTMYAYYSCDLGTASLRSLESDDQAAAQCLYPEAPTVILIDQTGSMSTGNRMADSQAAADQFVDTYASNMIAVAAFADPGVGCTDRPGYELLQDWTDDTALLQAAINSTSACGATPLWESACCAISKAEELSPSNIVIFTDTGENTSDGDCDGCVTGEDVINRVAGTDVVFYGVDMTDYDGTAAAAGPFAIADLSPLATVTDGDTLSMLANQTGGLYFKVDNPAQLQTARVVIQRHISRNSKFRQNPPDCNPGPYPIDVVQRYGPGCMPNSPYLGQTVIVTGRVTVVHGIFGPMEYIEDCSGGIQVRGVQGETGAIGDRVSVVGTVSMMASGEIKIDPVISYTVIGSPGLPPTAIVDPVNGQLCEMIGSLMSIRGFVAETIVDGHFPLASAIGTPAPQVIDVVLEPGAGIDPSPYPMGTEVVVTGILTHRSGNNELRPRSPADMQLITTDVEDGPPAILDHGILSVAPNPARGEAEISYALSRGGRVSLQVFDAQGRLVRTLINREQEANRYVTRWDGKTDRGDEASSGVYFVRFVDEEGFAQARQFLVLR